MKISLHYSQVCTTKGKRYIHYAPTHVLYYGGDAGTAW